LGYDLIYGLILRFRISSILNYSSDIAKTNVYQPVSTGWYCNLLFLLAT